MDDSAGTSIEPEEARFKVVLLGEGAVGKSSMMLRYVENKFNPRHLSTIQASFATKKLNIDGRDVELNIWDTAGQEKFHALGPIYYRDSHGALLIYDITGYKFVRPLKNGKDCDTEQRSTIAQRLAQQLFISKIRVRYPITIFCI
jgi:small GTP-binding protein